MSQGDRYRMPDGRDGIVIQEESEVLVLAPIVPDWPFPAPPVSLPRDWCTKLPSRYHEGALSG